MITSQASAPSCNLQPDATIYITDRGKKGLGRFFDISKWDIRVVKTGDTLNIGRRNLLFLETPMLHWPDSMMTYVREDKLLISQDAFGQHYASAARFDDEFIAGFSLSELEDCGEGLLCEHPDAFWRAHKEQDCGDTKAGT